MAKKRISGRQAAERLLAAIKAPDELTCEEAQELLPEFVQARFVGEDVESNPDYAALIKHLDRNDDCKVIYTKLMKNLKALIGEQALAQPEVVQTSYIAPARVREGFVLRVFQGLKRHFEFDLAVPNLSAKLAMLGSTRAGDAKRERLLSEPLPEVIGAPRVSVAVSVRNGPAELEVTIREKPGARWQVQLKAGDSIHTAKTDARGVAEFIDLRVAELEDLGEITLTFVELD